MSNFETKDSGERVQFESGMVRDTQEGKLRYDLAFDGPLFWAMYDGTPQEKLVRAAEQWYLYGGVNRAVAVIRAMAREKDTLFDFIIDPYAALMMRGAIKYSDRNWMKANGEEELKRFTQSFCRHFKQFLNGEVDEDHKAAIFFNLNGAEYVRGRLASEKKPCAQDMNYDKNCSSCTEPNA